MSSKQEEVYNDIMNSFAGLCQGACERHKIYPGYPEVTVFGFLLGQLHQSAPTELFEALDAYFEGRGDDSEIWTQLADTFRLVNS